MAEFNAVAMPVLVFTGSQQTRWCAAVSNNRGRDMGSEEIRFTVEGREDEAKVFPTRRRARRRRFHEERHPRNSVHSQNLPPPSS
jgi:hypothetical protein